LHCRADNIKGLHVRSPVLEFFQDLQYLRYLVVV
jgi:hypothetical protein